MAAILLIEDQEMEDQDLGLRVDGCGAQHELRVELRYDDVVNAARKSALWKRHRVERHDEPVRALPLASCVLRVRADAFVSI